MPTLKFSRQRESIKEFLSNRHDHPTADMVYENIREVYPNISLGTVYRNLSLLANLGEIRKLSTGEGADRFDANIRPHNHFICTACNSIIDVEMDNMEDVREAVEEKTGGEIESQVIYYYGTCKKCKKLKKSG